MLLKRLFRLFSNDLAIDLGTANTLVYVRDRGIILNEPSVVAIRTGSLSPGKTVLAVGQDAKSITVRSAIVATLEVLYWSKPSSRMTYALALFAICVQDLI